MFNKLFTCDFTCQKNKIESFQNIPFFGDFGDIFGET